VRVHDLPYGHLPSHLGDVKAYLEDMKRAIEPSLVLTHHGLDRHQDHEVVSRVTWQTFRDHMIWEYEIPKYDGDLTTPSLYVPLPATVAKRKVATILRIFKSQVRKPWLRSENLLALMHLRGLECRSATGYAEAFHCRKLVLNVSEVGAGSKSRARTRERPTVDTSS